LTLGHGKGGLTLRAGPAMVDQDASITSDLDEITSDVSIDPYVYMIGLGYKF
jgi:outer membrane protein W